MKKFFICSVIVIGLFFLSGCKKESARDIQQQQPTEQIINANVPAGQIYSFAATTGVINVGKQAAHYEISEIRGTAETGGATYQYKPAAGYRGADDVVLNVTETHQASGNGGGCQNNNHSNNTYIVKNTVVIKLTVTD
jgi:hypothetical protein